MKKESVGKLKHQSDFFISGVKIFWLHCQRGWPPFMCTKASQLHTFKLQRDIEQVSC